MMEDSIMTEILVGYQLVQKTVLRGLTSSDVDIRKQSLAKTGEDELCNPKFRCQNSA